MHIIASVKTTNTDLQDQNTMGNSTASSDSFYEGNSNPATATSGQIGEYITNARKKLAILRPSLPTKFRPEHSINQP